MIKINKKGKILSGDDLGWYILVQDDTENTGGYYIILSKDINFSGGLGDGFDTWIEKEEYVKEYFNKANWKIKWLD
jgi:hypothetical protein